MIDEAKIDEIRQAAQQRVPLLLNLEVMRLKVQFLEILMR